MIVNGVQEYLRSDNGSEFTSKKIRSWLSNMGVITAYIEPGSPWENGYIESFNSRMRNEFLKGELFGNMYEAEVLTKRWVTYYNTIRPYSSLGGRPPAPQVIASAPSS
jgi:transposase InsO family protein